MPESCALIMLRDRSPDVLWGEWLDAPCEPFAGRSSPCLCSEGSAAARWPEDAAALTAQFDAAMAHKRAVAVNSFVIAIAVWLFLLLVLGVLLPCGTDAERDRPPLIANRAHLIGPQLRVARLAARAVPLRVHRDPRERPGRVRALELDFFRALVRALALYGRAPQAVALLSNVVDREARSRAEEPLCEGLLGLARVDAG